jgi:hypothetical protein
MGLRSARRVALLAGVALVWTPAMAHAAVQIAVPHGCIYGSSSTTSQTIPFNVAGMAANSPYQVSLDGNTVATGTANASGQAAGSFASPKMRHSEREAVVSVTDGLTTDTKIIDLTDFDAAVTPVTGSAHRAVRVSMWGWVGKTVFLHYIAPGAKKPARTVRLAKTGGMCGHAQARIPHLFPRGAKAGTWKLVFDSSRRLRRSSDPFRIEYNIAVR